MAKPITTNGAANRGYHGLGQTRMLVAGGTVANTFHPDGVTVVDGRALKAANKKAALRPL